MSFLAMLSSCSCEGELCVGCMFRSECSFSWQEKWTELQNGPDVTVTTYKLCVGCMFRSECSFSWQEKWTELQNGPDVTVTTYKLCVGCMFRSECSFSWQEKWTELQNGPDVTVTTYKNHVQILRIKKFYLRKIFTLIIVYWIFSGKNLKHWKIFFLGWFIRIKQIALEHFSATDSELLSTVLRSNELFLHKCSSV